jgi:dynactin 1
VKRPIIPLYFFKEENEELRQEISVLKEEMASDCTESKAGSAALRSLEAQNMRLKEALLRLRDLSSSESFEARNTLAALQKEVSSLRAVEEKYAEEKKAKELLEGQVDELKLQLDDAATAETLVEKLTEKNLHLEEKLRALKNSAEQLELLLQMAEEMEVHHADIQRRLTEELDFCKSELSEEVAYFISA